VMAPSPPASLLLTWSYCQSSLMPNHRRLKLRLHGTTRRLRKLASLHKNEHTQKKKIVQTQQQGLSLTESGNCLYTRRRELHSFCLELLMSRSRKTPCKCRHSSTYYGNHEPANDCEHEIRSGKKKGKEKHGAYQERQRSAVLGQAADRLDARKSPDNARRRAEDRGA
jgi:hypothetical protein